MELQQHDIMETFPDFGGGGGGGVCVGGGGGRKGGKEKGH